MSGLWWVLSCNVSLNTPLFPTNWHQQCRNTPLWNPGTTNRKKREHTNTCSDLHRLRISTNMVVACLGAKPPIHVEFKMVVASHVVFIQCPASCPRLRQEYGRHQRTHPPQFATRQASPLSNVVAHRWQTKVATRLNRVKMTNRKKTNSINAEGKGEKKKTKGKT